MSGGSAPGVLAALLAGTCLAACAALREPGAAVEAEVLPGARWVLSFPVAGTLVSQVLVPGGRAAEGQVLAVLDPAPFEARVLVRSAALRAAEQRRVGGYMDPEALRAMLPSVVAPERFDALRVAVLQAELGVATAGLELRRALLDNQATMLRAPAQVVLQRWLAAEGTHLAAGAPVAEVADVSSVRVVIRPAPSWRPGTRVLAERADGTRLYGWLGARQADELGGGGAPVMMSESVVLEPGERLRISRP